MPLNFTNTRAIHRFGNWQGAYPLRSTKASRATIKPSRLIGAADPLYPQFLRANVFPEADIFGRAIVNKPGVYPYGSATGTTPVTSTSLKAGTYKRAKIKGKGVSKRKAAALWGRYVPAVADNTTTYPMVLNGWKKHTFDGTGTWGNRAWGGLQGQVDGCTDTHLIGIGGASEDRRVYSPNFTTSLVLPSAGERLGGVFVGVPTQATTVCIAFGISTETYPTLASWVTHLQSVGETVLYPLATSDGSVWKFVKDIGTDGTGTDFGYFNEATGEYVAAQGATGTLIQPITSISGVTPSADEITVRVGTNGYLLNTTTWALTSASGTLGADIPYMQIVPDIIETNVGDALYGQWGKNLWKLDDATDGYYYDSNGVLTATNDSRLTDYLPIEANTKYTLSATIASGSPNKRVNYFDENKNWLSQSVSASRSFTVTTPNGAKYIRISANYKGSGYIDYSTAMLNEGDTALPYEPYHFGLHPSGEQKAFMGEQGVVDLGTLNWTLTSSGMLQAINFPAKLPSNDNAVWTTAYCSEHTLTSANNIYYSRVDKAIGMWSANNALVARDSRYTTVASFKSAMSGVYLFYQRSTDASFIPPQTRTITTFLPSANSFIDAQKPSNNVECDWTIMAFTGANSENWIKNSDGIFYIVDEMFQKKDNQNGVLCDRYEYVKSSLTSLVTNGKFSIFCTFAEGTVAKIVVHDDRFTTVAEWKAHLASKPAIVAFPRETPEVTTVTLSELTQPLGTVTILNEFADGTKGAVDFYGVNIQVDNPVPKPDEPFPLLSNAGEVKVGYIQTQGKVVYDGSSDEVWTYDSGFHRFYLGSASLPADMKLGGTRTQQMFAPNWRCLWHGEAVSTAVNGDFYVGSSNVFFHSPEVSVAAFKAMLQTNPIELYYQRTSDPSFIQPTNGFFGDGQQTVKMESLNQLNDANVVMSKSDMPTNLNCVFKGYFGTSDEMIHYYTESTKYRVARAQLKAGTYTWWTDTPNCHTLRYSIGGVEGSRGSDLNYYTFTLTEDTEFQMCWRNQSSTEFSGEHSMIIPGSVVPTAYSPYATPQTRTTSEILPSATSKMNMQGGPDNKDCDRAFKVLDGTESWAAGDDYYTLGFPDLSGAALSDGACTHFQYTQNPAAGKFRFAGASVANGNVVFYVRGQFPTLDDWKAWLAENKPIVAYPRATSLKSTVQTTPFDIPKKTTYVLSSQAVDGQALDVQAMCVEEAIGTNTLSE